MGEPTRHAFIKLAEVQKATGTLYCGGLDLHAFPGGYEGNMRIYGYQNGGEIDKKSEAYDLYSQFSSFTGVPDEERHNFSGLLAAIEGYVKHVVDILQSSQCNVRIMKPQFGLYVQFGPLGLVLLQRIYQHIMRAEQQRGEEQVVILDCKPGDIDTTQKGYMLGYMGNLQESWGINYTPFGFDIINPTPWMGEDVFVLEDKNGNPLQGLKLLREGKCLIYVNKTSNGSGPQYQNMPANRNGDVKALYEHNAADAYALSLKHGLEHDGLSQLGLVIGATFPCDGSIRKLFPTFTGLHPGFGAQSVGEKALAPFKKVILELIRVGKWNGLGGVWSSSRATMFAYDKKYGGSGVIENLAKDLVRAIARHRELEETAFNLPEVVDAGIVNPFKKAA